MHISPQQTPIYYPWYGIFLWERGSTGRGRGVQQLAFAVLAQLVAVVGCEDDDRVVGHAHLLHFAHRTPHHVVHVPTAVK